MTEQQTNPSPAYHFRVTHPDPDLGERTIRLDAESDEAAPQAAKQWLAEANREPRWLADDVQVEAIPESEPEPVAEATGPGVSEATPGDLAE